MATSSDGAPPSIAAIVLGTAIVSGLTGYFIGQARSIGVFGGSDFSARSRHGMDSSDAEDDACDLGRRKADLVTPTKTRNVADDEGDDESEDSGEDLGELKTFTGNSEECKLVLVVRTDLGMTKGKIAAQCSHATLACYKAMVKANPAHPLLRRWEALGQAKVALKVDSEDDMLVLQAQAVSLGLCARVIHDAGRTQIASGSATVLGIGPAPKSKIDEVTGHLKLL